MANTGRPRVRSGERVSVRLDVDAAAALWAYCRARRLNRSDALNEILKRTRAGRASASGRGF